MIQLKKALERTVHNTIQLQSSSLPNKLTYTETKKMFIYILPGFVDVS